MVKRIFGAGLVLAMVIAGAAVSARQSVSAGGAFLPLQDYVVSGQWTMTNASPLVLTNLSGILLGNGSSAVTAVASTGTGSIVRATSPTIATATLTSPTMTSPALGVATGTSLTATGSIKSSSATAGVGYTTGAGGVIAQSGSRTTTVQVDTITGAITLVSAAGSATPASFTVTDAAVAATDVVIVNQKSGTDKYEIFVTNVGAGSFVITFFTTGGTTTETPVFNFAVIKGVAS